ncbi:short chain dehydrogenase [Burkholderia pseudomallei]|uniref:SDR family oxidoreductase n=1 Tax=Burkholderia pseudomallei TaxID=28450 RepID=UPI00018A54FE|nr:SDR family oxidoreductase [Burkholderia pseudomallei]AIO96565.1 short chain dehydrogenase family protein [Burkholderia pseudomallei 576]EEC33265.1 oxidoreductase, short chain dehydrogenase/reductase family [Burkholderia pseudomallei 576]KGD27803.1 short chain dehydrogenase family protein [Burkholderia pseudomallei]MBF3992974.1 SDR family oxidoreductase [Burkholderia pseudomallei]NAX10594.1 SDR family oxidoreductase [Burkholderia pseudomallei]
MQASFNDQRVLVIGGSSGIGAAAAHAFAVLDADVTIASRDANKLAGAARAIDGPRPVRQAVLDTTDAPAVDAFFAEAGPFDHVVMSAAHTPGGPVRKLPLADAQAAMDSKFWGAYRVARAARIAPGGSLTFVSGFLSVRPSASAVLQGAINAALEALARGLALELAPVRVNTVSPGLVATPLWSKLDDAAREAMYASAAARLPARRVGQPEDIANAIVYLAATRYATGSTVLVDGGGAIA